MLFVVPAACAIIALFGYPVVKNAVMGFQDYGLKTFFTGQAPFVGLSNYVEVVTDPVFSKAVVNTALFTLGSIIGQFVIGMLLALFFHKSFPLNGVLRALFLLPWLLPLIVSGSTWSWMLNSENGIVNSVLQAFGVGQINWLTSPGTALLSVTIANIWLGVPFNLVILYAGLQNIPAELYEAGALDGAGRWQQFRHITLPLLRPVSAIVLLLGLIYTLKVVDIVWIMTTGGPADASTTLAVWSYREAFGTGQPDFSPAAAVGNLLIVIALVAGLIHLRLQRKEDLG